MSCPFTKSSTWSTSIQLGAETVAVTRSRSLICRTVSPICALPTSSLRKGPQLTIAWPALAQTVKPDLVLTHRPNDYHPDHRVVGQLGAGGAHQHPRPAPDDDLDRLKRLDGFPITDEQVRSAQERANREPF